MHKYPKQYVIGQEYVRDQITSISKETKTYKIGSTRIRINMGKRAVKYFFDSKMMGVGAGNFDEKSQKGYFGDIDWIQNPHSYIFELLSNYGIIVIIPFGIFIVTLGLRLLKIVSKTTGRLRTLALFNFISIIVFLIVSNLPSSMFNIYVIWIHLGYLASFVKCNT
jgi:O-antigen ligase